MAAVTYDGVESTEGGNIFKDINFWVSQRVPMRKSLEEQIRVNGGIVVPLEKRADILIADHAKPKLAPSGSYSWKFIEDSIKNGYIQLKDHYLIGLHPDMPRPAGGGGSTKSTRAAFTAAEDAALVKWVLAHPNRTGNKIFQEFETMNPRHPWQSWRNRFVKNLQLLPIDKLQQMADSAPDQPSSSPTKQVEPTPAKRPQEPRGEELVKQSKSNLTQDTEPKTHLEQTSEPVAERPVEHINQLNSQTPIRTREQVETLSEDEPADPAKMMFYEDLNQYIAATGAEIKLRPKIKNTVIDLFDLSMAVVSIQEEGDSQGLDETNWARVAEFLGFDPQDETATTQLRQCHEEYLAEFEEAMADYDANSNDEIEVGTEIEPAANAERDEPLPHAVASSNTSWNERELSPSQEGEWEDSPSRQSLARPRPSYARSSPPVGTKRTRDQVPPVSPGLVTKRLRFDRNSEIPSTPDMENRGGRRVRSAQYLSPSIQKSVTHQDYVDASDASQHLPPLPPAEDEPHAREENEVEEDERQEEALLIFETQPSIPRATPQLSPSLGERDTPADITPSQQLRGEALNPSPIPFSLDRSRQTKKSSTFGRSISYPMQRTDTNLSSQHRTHRAHRTASPKPPTATTRKESKAPRRSLPLSFNANSHLPSKTVGRDSPTALKQAQSTGSHIPTQLASSGSNYRDIDEWIKHYESLGFPRSIVIEGLARTTLTPGNLANLVMQKLQAEEGVPSHHEGIWTDRDDNDLTSLNAVDLHRQPNGEIEQRRYRKARKALRRLTNKHGAEGMELRKRFLEAQGADEQRDCKE